MGLGEHYGPNRKKNEGGVNWGRSGLKRRKGKAQVFERFCLGLILFVSFWNKLRVTLLSGAVASSTSSSPFVSFISPTQGHWFPPTFDYRAPLPSSSPHSCSVKDGKKGNEFLDTLGFFLISVFACHDSLIIESDFVFYCRFCERKKGREGVYTLGFWEMEMRRTGGAEDGRRAEVRWWWTWNPGTLYSLSFALLFGDALLKACVAFCMPCDESFLRLLGIFDSFPLFF